MLIAHIWMSYNVSKSRGFRLLFRTDQISWFEFLLILFIKWLTLLILFGGDNARLNMIENMDWIQIAIPWKHVHIHIRDTADGKRVVKRARRFICVYIYRYGDNFKLIVSETSAFILNPLLP